MVGIVILICTAAVLDISACNPIRNADHKNDVIYVVNARGNSSACTYHVAESWSHEFHNCFIDRKYGDGGRDLNNIVDRILEHSRDCIESNAKECRPNYKGFMVIMKKVIMQMKDYCFLYLEHISHGRDKIKDLDCVENSLSNQTYERCFKSVFTDEAYESEEKFQMEIEKAISCTNKSNKLCSKAAKTSLNRMVRTILRVKQPKKEDIVDDVKSQPPKMWYDYIFQPFVTMWNAIRSFFGF